MAVETEPSRRGPAGKLRGVLSCPRVLHGPIVMEAVLTTGYDPLRLSMTIVLAQHGLFQFTAAATACWRAK
jgi:hypothetical protein